MPVGESETGLRRDRTERPTLTHSGHWRILKKIDVLGTNYEELFGLQEFPARDIVARHTDPVANMSRWEVLILGRACNALPSARSGGTYLSYHRPKPLDALSITFGKRRLHSTVIVYVREAWLEAAIKY